MIIELELPFKELYLRGYIVTSPENRKLVILYNSEEDRTSISYARYLMCCLYNTILPDGIEVDHIDNDKTNDSLDNLQLLTPEQNLAKGRSRTMVTLICPGCGKEFSRERRQTHLVKGGNHSKCSRSCANTKYHIK